MAALRNMNAIQGRIRWYAQRRGPEHTPIWGLGMKLQESASGVQPILKQKTWARIRPIQTAGAETPIRTKTIVVRSGIERGRSAERMPVGIASNVQKNAPPKTSDAVTGASCATTQRTDVPKRNEYPSEACRTMFQRKSQYCWYIGRSR